MKLTKNQKSNPNNSRGIIKLKLFEQQLKTAIQLFGQDIIWKGNHISSNSYPQLYRFYRKCMRSIKKIHATQSFSGDDQKNIYFQQNEYFQEVQHMQIQQKQDLQKITQIDRLVIQIQKKILRLFKGTLVKLTQSVEHSSPWKPKLKHNSTKKLKKFEMKYYKLLQTRISNKFQEQVIQNLNTMRIDQQKILSYYEDRCNTLSDKSKEKVLNSYGKMTQSAVIRAQKFQIGLIMPAQHVNLNFQNTIQIDQFIEHKIFCQSYLQRENDNYLISQQNESINEEVIFAQKEEEMEMKAERILTEEEQKIRDRYISKWQSDSALNNQNTIQSFELPTTNGDFSFQDEEEKQQDLPDQLSEKYLQ